MKVAERIEKKLAFFSPEKLVVTDESYKHRGHAGAPAGGESHFDVLIVSKYFQSMSRVKRHQAVYKVLDEELKGPIHALSLQTLTPEEYSTL